MDIRSPVATPAGAGWLNTCEHGGSTPPVFPLQVLYSGSRPTERSPCSAPMCTDRTVQGPGSERKLHRCGSACQRKFGLIAAAKHSVTNEKAGRPYGSRSPPSPPSALQPVATEVSLGRRSYAGFYFGLYKSIRLLKSGMREVYRSCSIVQAGKWCPLLHPLAGRLPRTNGRNGNRHPRRKDPCSSTRRGARGAGSEVGRASLECPRCGGA